jgi:hypothetical protein
MLFANIIVGVYCFYELLISLIKKEGIAKKKALIFLFIGFIYYCYLEFFGTRANSELGGSSTASIFSMEFVFQLRQSYWNFLGMLKQVHKVLLSFSLYVIFFALILCILNRQNEKEKSLVRMGLICFLSFASLVPGLVLICGKAGPNYSSLIQCMYGIFFYYFLLTGIALMYLLSRFKKAFVIVPFLLLILFNETTNSTNRFAEQAYFNEDYFGNKITSSQKKQFVNQWISAIKEADQIGESAVIIQAPLSANPEWPISVERFGELFSHTLYSHNIISRPLRIGIELNGGLTAWLEHSQIISDDPEGQEEDQNGDILPETEGF